MRWLSSPHDYANVLSGYDTWMFDCDGVLWNGEKLVDGAVEVLQMLRANQKKVLFVSNNSTDSRVDIQKKFAKIGVFAAIDEIFSAAYISAVYISSILRLPKSGKVYLIGMKGLEEELGSEGVSFVGGTDPADCSFSSSNPSNFAVTLDPTVSVVLCGLDFAFTFTKLSKAYRYLSSSQKCRFVAVNTYSTAKGSTLPGAGSLVEALKVSTGREPICAGKPSTLMLECVRKKIGYDPRRTIMIGDRLDADISFGKRGGFATLLVLTGETAASELASPSISAIPDYVTNSLGDFCLLLKSE